MSERKTGDTRFPKAPRYVVLYETFLAATKKKKKENEKETKVRERETREKRMASSQNCTS